MNDRITCASCGCNLTTSGISTDYRVKLCSERIPPDQTGSVGDMEMYPEFDRPVYFCDRDCLKSWIGRDA